jgi:tetratricopeptide (TPR) repeat protein
MKRFLWLLVALFVSPLLSAHGQSSKAASDLLRRGNARYSKGDIDQAIRDFTNALEIDPDLTDALLSRGRALKVKGDFDGAISDFEKAADVDARILNNNVEVAGVYTTRGNLRVNSFDLDGAVADFDKALRCAAGNPDTYIKRGEAKLIRGDLEESIRDFDAGLLLHPGKLQASLALAGRGYANLLNGSEAQAERDFQQSVTLNSEGKFFLTLHLKLLESRIREVRRRRNSEQQLFARFG